MKITYITLGLGCAILSQATDCIFNGISFYGAAGNQVDPDIKPYSCQQVPEGYSESVWVRKITAVAVSLANLDQIGGTSEGCSCVFFTDTRCEKDAWDVDGGMPAMIRYEPYDSGLLTISYKSGSYLCGADVSMSR